jgi:hypothetical protein
MDKPEFLYLKLGKGNCLAEYLLGNDNVFKRPTAAIFFGPITAEEFKHLIDIDRKDNEKKKKEYEQLCKAHEMKDSQRSKRILTDLKQIASFFNTRRMTKFVTITSPYVYIYEPDGPVKTLDDKKLQSKYDKEGIDKLIERARKGKDKTLEHNLTEAKISKNGKIEQLPKYMPVKLDAKPFEIKNVPHVLATLPCNQSFGRHTCIEIKEEDQQGAYWAAKCLLGNQPHISIPNLSDFTPEKFLSLLGQYELETLLFLVLHNKGLFVPSWRGGTLEDVDIIAKNKTDKPINVGDIKFETLETKTFQVKRGKIRKPINANYIVALSSQTENNKEKIRDAKWLLERVEEQQETKQWLRDLLDWVKNINDFLKPSTGE